MSSMLEKLFLRSFIVCLISCASLVLSFIWGGDPDDLYAHIAASLFIIGLGSFLFWFVSFFYNLKKQLYPV